MLVLSAVLAVTVPPPLVPSEVRGAVSQLLVEAVRSGPSDAVSVDQRLESLVEAGEAAAHTLGDTYSAEVVRRELEAARWRALFDVELALSELSSDFERIAEDLVFEPLMEAELPVGFPAPTPVLSIELRSYPAYRMAQVETGSSNGGFWPLFRHITERDIAMTAPVEMTYAEDGGRMAFLYGSREIGATGAAEDDVRVLDVEPGMAVSLGLRGRMTTESLAAATSALLRRVESDPELEVAGPLRTMGYNSPMVSRSKQYYEVQIPVKKKSERVTVIDFGDPQQVDAWRVVNDTVMGGVSSSRIYSDQQGGAVFTGAVSLDNNGGFASVRAWPEGLDLAGADGVRLRFRGDGNTYKLRFRTDGAYDGLSYERRFETVDGEWMERELRFEDFVPVWRGNRVPGAGPLRPEAIVGVGLMISDEQEGDFRLELESLERL